MSLWQSGQSARIVKPCVVGEKPCNDCIWRGQKETASFIDASHVCIAIASSVDKRKLPQSKMQVMSI
jgi:hypothetical protein